MMVPPGFVRSSAVGARLRRANPGQKMPMVSLCLIECPI